MSAETLRRAASLMRERADGASESAPSPWFVSEFEIVTDDQEPIETISVLTSDLHWRDAAAQRAHVASWHPAVALTVADWLAECARLWEYGDVGPLMWKQANTVARAYLGGDAR